MENFYVYQTKRTRSNYVIYLDGLHKGKKFQFRADAEQTRYIEELAKEFGQSDSKVIKDIIDDFFLERKLKAQKEDVEHFLRNV